MSESKEGEIGRRQFLGAAATASLMTVSYTHLTLPTNSRV